MSTSASKSSIRRFVITEKAPSRAFSWLKAATTAFTFKTLLSVGAFSVITNLWMELFEALVDTIYCHLPGEVAEAAAGQRPLASCPSPSSRLLVKLGPRKLFCNIRRWRTIKVRKRIEYLSQPHLVYPPMPAAGHCYDVAITCPAIVCRYSVSCITIHYITLHYITLRMLSVNNNNLISKQDINVSKCSECKYLHICIVPHIHNKLRVHYACQIMILRKKIKAAWNH